MDLAFINRHKELNYFQNDFENNYERNRIVMLTGKSGIGKSVFAGKLVESVHPNSIKIPFENGIGDAISNDSFLKTIGKYINQYAKLYNPELEIDYFLSNLKGDTIREFYNELLSGQLFDIDSVKLIRPLKTIYDRKFSKGTFSGESLFDLCESQELIIIADYLKYFFKNQKRSLINIENFQLIDSMSLKVFKEIFKEANNHYFLLECTLKDNNDEMPYVLQKNLELYQDNFDIIPLKRLSRKDFKRLISSNNKTLDRVLDQIYDLYHGNARQVKDLRVLLSKESMNFDWEVIEGETINLNQTERNIKSLRPSDQFILVAIIAHSSMVAIGQLSYLLRAPILKNNFYDIEGSIKRLSEQKLVKINADNIIIDHDSIANNILTNEVFETKLIVAYKVWLQFYENIYDLNDYSTISKQQVVSKMFFYMLRTTPQSILKIIDDLLDIAINSGHPETSKMYIKELYQFVIDSPVPQSRSIINLVKFSIVDIYYYVGFFPEAFEVLKSIDDDCYRRRLYYAALLDRIGPNEKAIEYIENELSKLNHAKAPFSYKLSLELILLISYRALGRFIECRQIFKKIENNTAYRNVYEYGFFLRNAETIFTGVELLPYLDQSIDFFKKRENQVHEAEARISKACHLTYLGRLNDAMNEMISAQRMLNKKTLEHHILHNNIAVIRLYMRKFDFETESLLQKAFSTAYEQFDQTQILSNLLVIKTKINKASECDEIIEKLIGLTVDQDDPVLLNGVYFNISMYYKECALQGLSERYMEKIQNYSEKKNSYWENRIKGVSDTSQNYKFLSKFDFHADFIVYWHFDINKFQ